MDDDDMPYGRADRFQREREEPRRYDDRERDRRSRSPDLKRRRSRSPYRPRDRSFDNPRPRYRRDSDDYNSYGRESRDRERVPNPRDLKYLVSKKHFKDYMRQVSGLRDDPDWDRKYDGYKEDFKMQEAVDFWEGHRAEEWFVEKYKEGSTEFNEHRERVKNEKAGLFEKFGRDLEAGLFDDACFDVPSGEVEGMGEGQSSGPAKQDEEMADTDPSSPVSPALPNPSSTKRPLAWESPEDESDVAHKLFIKSVPVNVGRKALEEKLAEVLPTPPIRLSLSDPNPSKKFIRLGWITFPAGTPLPPLLSALSGFKIADTELAFAPHQTHPPRSRVVTEAFAKADRMKRDLEMCAAVARAMDSELGVDGVGVLEAKVGKLPGGETEGMEIEGEGENGNGENGGETKKKLDLLIAYLRRVHLYDYYSGMGTDSVEDFSRKLPPNLRPSPETTQTDEFTSRKALERVDARARYYGKLLTPLEISALEWRDPQLQSESKLRSFMKEEGESRYRCMMLDPTGKECGKLFKAPEFVEKHLQLKHPETTSIAEEARRDAEYTNAYVRDPGRLSVMKEVETGRYGERERERRSTGSGFGGTPRGRGGINSRLGPREEEYVSPVSVPVAMMGRMDKRALRDYTDLDAVGPPPAGDVDISYD